MDDSEWPLLRVAFPGSQYTYTDVAEMFRAVDAFYARNLEPFAWVVDSTRVSFADAKIRQLTAEHEERTKEHKRRYNCGTGFVIQSGLVRGILTAVFWLSPPAYPYQVFANCEAARAWALNQLGKRARATSGRASASGGRV